MLGPGDIVCLHTVRSDRFLIFMRETEQGDLGRGAAARRERVVSALRARIELTEAGSVLRSLRLAAGHARLAGDLGGNPGRAIQQAVTDAVLVSLVEREGIEAVRRDELSRLIGDGGVRTVFHPIVRLADEQVIGHEALTRPPGRTVLRLGRGAVRVRGVDGDAAGLRAALPADRHRVRRQPAAARACSS